MNKVVATTDAIRRYGDVSVTIATDVALAGATNQVATMAAAIPIFGLIGQDFLPAFAVAQANNLTSVAELAHVYGMSAVAAYEGAALYDGTETVASADFGKING